MGGDGETALWIEIEPCLHDGRNLGDPSGQQISGTAGDIEQKDDIDAIARLDAPADICHQWHGQSQAMVGAGIGRFHQLIGRQVDGKVTHRAAELKPRRTMHAHIAAGMDATGEQRPSRGHHIRAIEDQVGVTLGGGRPLSVIHCGPAIGHGPVLA